MSQHFRLPHSTIEATPQSAPTLMRGLTHSLDDTKEGLAVDATHTLSCSVPQCDRPAKRRGLCGAHYARVRRTGSVGTAPIEDHSVKTLAERFWAKVDKNGPIMRAELGQCWVWTAATKDGGYGVMRPSGQRSGPAVKAHRVSLMIAGVDIDGLVVRHRCDNPPCVNPSHLETGTQVENVEDIVERGRIARGSMRSKLTDDDIRTIRRRAAAGDLHREIAADFGISRVNVTRIVNRQGWAHVA